MSKSFLLNARKLAENYTKTNQKKTLSQIKHLVFQTKPTIRSQTVRFSLIKKIFREHSKADEEFLHSIRPKDEITQRVKQENEQRRDSRKLKTIDKDQITKILSFSDSDKAKEQGIYLLLVCGRRVSELLTSSFRNVIGTRGSIRADGLKKRTDSGNDCQVLLLVKKTKFFKILHQFRKKIKGHSTKAVHRALDRSIKKHLGNDWTPHTLRKIYANYAFQFRNKQRLKLNPFIRDVLCHQSVLSSLNYTGVSFSFQQDLIR